jgi:dihydrodipicolinate synthase/N-acetylneuraminate lyase
MANDPTATVEAREAWIREWFPDGIPRLWCPPLTHYTDSGGLDRRRIEAHLRTLARDAPGWLVPGSTGDGWELSREETRELLDLVCAVASEHGAHVLIGALRKDHHEAGEEIDDLVNWMVRRAATTDPITALRQHRVCGFAVCPPAGSHRTQTEISAALVAILQRNMPLALYQLPQVTENEMTPSTVADLAGRFAHFYLFKDTSGADHVATEGVDLGNVFLVRGAEGDYLRWYKGAGGPYDGFLLSSANGFARQLKQMISIANAGEANRAAQMITPVQEVVQQVFQWAEAIPVGNVFTNANKAIDHFLAHGSAAEHVPPPRLHAGPSLDPEILQRTGKLLREHNFLPEQGYLARS